VVAAGRRADRAAAAGARTGASAAMETCLCGSSWWPLPRALSSLPSPARLRRETVASGGDCGFYARCERRPMMPVMPQDNVSRAAARRTPPRLTLWIGAFFSFSLV
jgi:hypothetical protein